MDQDARRRYARLRLAAYTLASLLPPTEHVGDRHFADILSHTGLPEGVKIANAVHELRSILEGV